MFHKSVWLRPRLLVKLRPTMGNAPATQTASVKKTMAVDCLRTRLPQVFNDGDAAGPVTKVSQLANRSRLLGFGFPRGQHSDESSFGKGIAVLNGHHVPRLEPFE